MTKQELHHAILRGRAAIEECLLSALLRPWLIHPAEEGDYEALSDLLKRYNRIMEKHMPHKITAQAANDDIGGAL